MQHSTWTEIAMLYRYIYLKIKIIHVPLGPPLPCLPSSQTAWRLVGGVLLVVLLLLNALLVLLSQ